MEKYPLPEMTLRELVLGIILLKEKNNVFEEAALEHGLRKCSDEYPMLKNLFRMHSDGAAERTNTLSTILTFAEMSNILESGDLSMPHILMGKYGKKAVEKELKTDYGENIFEVLKPFADAVWREAYDRGV